MFNLSSVSIKIMFRKKGYLGKSENYWFSTDFFYCE
jgi:hypothetical protein